MFAHAFSRRSNKSFNDLLPARIYRLRQERGVATLHKVPECDIADVVPAATRRRDLRQLQFEFHQFRCCRHLPRSLQEGRTGASAIPIDLTLRLRGALPRLPWRTKPRRSWTNAPPHRFGCRFNLLIRKLQIALAFYLLDALTYRS